MEEGERLSKKQLAQENRIKELRASADELKAAVARAEAVAAAERQKVGRLCLHSLTQHSSLLLVRHQESTLTTNDLRSHFHVITSLSSAALCDLLDLPMAGGRWTVRLCACRLRQRRPRAQRQRPTARG